MPIDIKEITAPQEATKIEKELVRFNEQVENVNQLMMMVVLILLVMVATMVIDAIQNEAGSQQNLSGQVQELNLRLENQSKSAVAGKI